MSRLFDNRYIVSSAQSTRIKFCDLVCLHPTRSGSIYCIEPLSSNLDSQCMVLDGETIRFIIETCVKIETPVLCQLSQG